MAGGECKAATTKRSRGCHIASPYMRNDPNRRLSRPRRRATETWRDAREAKGDQGVPLAHLTYGLDLTNRGHIEVVRTEPCSPALSALAMAAAGYREAVGQCTGQQSPHNHQNGLYSPPLIDPFSVHQAPQPQYPIPSSMSTSLMSQDQPATTGAQMQAMSSHHAISPSRQSSSMSTTYPPRGSNSMRFSTPLPLILARSLSWVPYPLVPFTEQAASTHASNLGPVVHCLQAPGQDGHTMDYPHPIRTSGPRNCRCVSFNSNTYPQNTINNH